MTKTMKHLNGVIRNAHEAASALAAEDLDFAVSLAFFEAVEAIGPLARGIENERQKLVVRIGESPEGIVLTENPTDEQRAVYERKMSAYRQEFARLLAVEQEVPALPTITVAMEDVRGVRLSGYQIGALKAIGVLQIAAAE